MHFERKNKIVLCQQQNLDGCDFLMIGDWPHVGPLPNNTIAFNLT